MSLHQLIVGTFRVARIRRNKRGGIATSKGVAVRGGVLSRVLPGCPRLSGLSMRVVEPKRRSHCAGAVVSVVPVSAGMLKGVKSKVARALANICMVLANMSRGKGRTRRFKSDRNGLGRGLCLGHTNAPKSSSCVISFSIILGPKVKRRERNMLTTRRTYSRFVRVFQRRVGGFENSLYARERRCRSIIHPKGGHILVMGRITKRNTVCSASLFTGRPSKARGNHSVVSVKGVPIVIAPGRCHSKVVHSVR